MQQLFPGDRSLAELRATAADCRNCELYRNATQTVFGEGPSDADVVMVGEQPGDSEDLEGRPFVGPAGRVLDRALGEAGIERERVYVTNAVKHFKWRPRGKRRIHTTPSAGEIRACRPWLDGELAAIDPTVVVCLGATAAKALLGPSFRVTQQRGQLMTVGGRLITATVHPSSILRVPEDQREVAYADFVADLTAIAARLP
jgi:DNA polymerase